MAQQVEITIVGKDRASSVFQSVGKAAGGLGNMLSTAIGTAAGIGIAKVAGAVANVGGELGGMIAQAPQLAAIEASFAGIAENAEASLSRLREGSRGLVSDADLMQSYNKAAQLVGTTFAEQLPDAMSSLQKVAGATGQDVGFLLDSLTTGIGRLSPMILDNLGIQVNLTEAYEDYAATLGKSASELSKTEQQTALMNQVMEKLATNTADMPEPEINAWQQFGTTLENLKGTIGVALLPLVNEILNPLAEWFQAHAPQIQSAITSIANAFRLLITGDFEGGIFGMFEDDERIAKLFALRDGILNFFQLIKDAFTTFQQAISGDWADSGIIHPFHRIIGIIGQVVAAFGEGGLSGAIAVLLPYVQQAFQSLIAYIEGALPGWIATLVGWGQAAWQWILEAIPPALEQLGEWAGQLIQFIADNLPEWIVQLAEWGTEAVKWIGEAIPPLIVAAGEFLSNLITWAAETALPAIAEQASKWAVALYEWVRDELIPEIGPALAEFLEESERVLFDVVLPALAEAGRKIGAALWDALTGAIGNVGDWLQGQISNINVSLPDLNPFNNDPVSPVAPGPGKSGNRGGANFAGGPVSITIQDSRNPDQTARTVLEAIGAAGGAY